MCLILIAKDYHPKYKLIIAANRDELYERLSFSLHYWDDGSDIYAGKDLKAGGSWFGINKTGKLAAITNFREMNNIKKSRYDKDVPYTPSRGKLVIDYLRNNISVDEYKNYLNKTANDFNGYNLIYGNINELFYFSNETKDFKELNQGIYGISNHLLDTPWFKVRKGKYLFNELLKNDEIIVDDIFKILMDDEKANDNELPATGLSKQIEKEISSIFIKTEKYGTRSSTILLVDKEDNGNLIERNYDYGEQKVSDINFFLKFNK